MSDVMSEAEIRRALRILGAEVEVPVVDPTREAALLAAFDEHWTGTARRSRSSGGAWWLSALAATAALLLAVIVPSRTSVPRADLSPPVGEFLPWPGAADLPPLESGELVRVDLPVALLPSLGVAPPSGHATAVKADVVIGQDGLARAVRFVGD